MRPATSLLLAFTSLPLMSIAASYTAEKASESGVDVVRLSDPAHKTVVSIAPSLGNNAYAMEVNGQNVFWSPYAGVAEFKAKPAHLGNPFLAPWANRLSEDAFYANGRKYQLNQSLQNYRHDGNGKPIHGLLVYAPEWRVVKLHADDGVAEVTSRLEFWRFPAYMAQFPFAHTIDMTYRLKDGVLEVETSIENLSTDPMPVSVGYHPYFRLHDSQRDEWRVMLPAKRQILLSPQLIPTGETKPMDRPRPMPLNGAQLDDVFSELERSSAGTADFSIEGKKQKIVVSYGPKYPVAVVYAPPGRNFVCFEPMTGPTNAFNLAHEGKYKELQSVPPAGKWRESFWIRPSGF